MTDKNSGERKKLSLSLEGKLSLKNSVNSKLTGSITTNARSGRNTVQVEVKRVKRVNENKNEDLRKSTEVTQNLSAEQIIIGGFSQGCMITLQTGLKRKDKVNSVIGYSGRIIDTEHLSKNINSRPNVILMHGDLDQVVSIDSFLEAKEFFGKNNYEIETKIFKNCEHRIPTEGSSLGLQFIKKHFNT